MSRRRKKYLQSTSLHQLITQTYLDESLQSIYNVILVLGPVQNDAGVIGGMSIADFGVLAALADTPAFACVQDALKN